MSKSKKNIEFFNTHVSPQAKKNVKDVLDSTWLNEGKYVKEFEKQLRNDWGLQNPALTNSCTSALHLSLVCAGVKPGDEVILPAQTFIATGMAVLAVGATPVFADIDPDTGNLHWEDWQRRVTHRTKALIAVHWGGNPCQMNSIHAQCKDKGIEVIEDAAHAFGALKYDDAPVGGCKLDSKYVCFSFQAIKFLTSGDGGCVCTHDEETYEELVRRKWFGFDKSKMTKRFEGDRGTLVTEMGFKFHMNDVAAAIGVGNLSGARKRLRRRQEIARRYNEEFKDVGGVTLLETPYKARHSYWLYTMRVEHRHDFIFNMASCGVPTSVVDRRIDEHPVFGGLTKGLKGQREFDRTQISIPVHDGLSDEDVDHIIKSVKAGW